MVLELFRFWGAQNTIMNKHMHSQQQQWAILNNIFQLSNYIFRNRFPIWTHLNICTLKGNFAWWKYTTTLTVITPWLLAAVVWRWIILSLLSFYCASLCKINFLCSQPGPENRSALQGVWLHGALGQKSHLGPPQLPLPVQGSSTGLWLCRHCQLGRNCSEHPGPPSHSPRQITDSRSEQKWRFSCITQTPARSTAQCNSLYCDSQCDTGNICSGSQQFHLLHLQKHFTLSNGGKYSRSQGKSSINSFWYLKWKTCLLTFFQAFLSQGHIKKSPFEYMHGFTFYIVTEVLYRIYLFCDTLVSTEFCEPGVSTCFQIRYLKRRIFLYTV